MKIIEPVIIPSYQPDQRLVELVGSLQAVGFSKIFIVDDGSSKDKEVIFDQLKSRPGVFLLRHAVNLGKGAALKMSINHVLVNDPKCLGVLTVDGDGQHTVADVKKVADQALATPSALVLGARGFREGVPFRSRIGNIMTKYVFRFLVGKSLADTQTGLRFIPRSLMCELLTLTSNRYEFELDMLIVAIKKNFSLIEIPISTIYEEGNKTSHFNPFLDSFRIYFVFLRFVSLSLFVYGTDLIIFTLVYKTNHQMFSSILFGRIAGAVVGIVGSRKFVFKSDKKVLEVVLKLVALWFFLLGASYGLMLIFSENWHVNVYVSRIVVDSGLFVVNFLIQRDMIFVESGRSLLRRFGLRTSV
jgi:glycosyltransferase involved in cell wall biosynthesis